MMAVKPPVIILLLVSAVTMLVTHMPSISRRSFEEKLRKAARRGVTDGIVIELEMLRARSRALGV